MFCAKHIITLLNSFTHECALNKLKMKKNSFSTNKLASPQFLTFPIL